MPPRSVLGAMSAWASAKRGFCSLSDMRDCRLARSEEQPRCIFRVPFGGLWLSVFSTACARPARKLRQPRQQEAAASSFHGRSERGWKAGGGRKREADPMQPSSLPRPVQQIRAAPAALLAKVLPLLARPSGRGSVSCPGPCQQEERLGRRGRRSRCRPEGEQQPQAWHLPLRWHPLLQVQTNTRA